MHFTTTFVVSVLAACAAAAPLQKRQTSDVIAEATGVNDPLADLVENVVDGTQGFSTVLGGVVDQLENLGKRDTADANNPVVDLLVNIEGGLEGFSTILEGVGGQLQNLKRTS